MKYAITGVVVALIGGGYWLSQPVVAENVQTVIQTVTETVEVSELDRRIEEAQNASSSAIEDAAKAAYEETKKQKLLEVELRVTSEYRAEIEQRETELEKEAGLY